jgi:hypothetical protein
MKISFLTNVLCAIVCATGALAGEKDFYRVMANQTLICNVNGAPSETLSISFDKKADVAKSDFCWGGDESEFDFSRSTVRISCGDDGRGHLLISSSFDKYSKPTACARRANGKIDWESSALIEAISWQNMSAGYPYKDGNVQYLACCLK